MSEPICMTKKYRTRDWRDVRVLCVDAPGDLPVIAIARNGAYSWDSVGRLYGYDGGESPLDLIEVKPEPERPESLAAHQSDYREGAWSEYTIAELGQWVHLLSIRATHRVNPEKRAKDLADAQSYLDIMQAKLIALTGGLDE